MRLESHGAPDECQLPYAACERLHEQRVDRDAFEHLTLPFMHSKPHVVNVDPRSTPMDNPENCRRVGSPKGMMPPNRNEPMFEGILLAGYSIRKKKEGA
ncbi:hypothetical protein NDU88_006295 [Pleurodeles waltl]|uniref:Uncharacterized protein n=1 Tax=Pleurodeles waltl TaxID=8319 RepID=A0AAV7WA64_PLEWA|nr:hypothetical protein NDU88_006295 [Pleurodeles waltl]